MNFLVFSSLCLNHGNNLLDYAVSETDLGISMNTTLNAILLYNKANQLCGLLKITCHFIDNKKIPLLIYGALYF